jgi:hypothetical protein
MEDDQSAQDDGNSLNLGERMKVEKYEMPAVAVARMKKRLKPLMDSYYRKRGDMDIAQFGINCYLQGIEDALQWIEKLTEEACETD